MLNDNNERLFVFRRETMNMVRSASGIERLSDQLRSIVGFALLMSCLPSLARSC